VALARAFLKRAPILLLDEPTAGLDAENERLVLDSLVQLWQGCSVLMATHRLDHLTRMDRVMVLQAGRIVEDGPLNRLRAGDGPFARLDARQFEEI
jgi:ABC-type transport system involved in cytochrome bd biosynthesis fused ATPase/permease subunit